MRILVITKVLLSFGLLAVLFSWIDFDILLGEFANLHWGWLVGGLAIMQTQYLLSTLKWRVILKADGFRVPFLFLWRTYLIGGFLSLFLPSSFGGDGYRVWALKQRGIEVSTSTASVLFDRLTGVFALVTIGMAGALFLVGARFVAVLLVAYCLGIAAFLILTSGGALARLPDHAPKVLGFFVRMLRSVGAYRRSMGRFFAMLGLSFVFQFNIVLVVVCYAHALRIPANAISFLEFVAMVPVVYLTEMLPITINGIGVRDGAFVFFFNKLGGTTEQAIGLSLLVVAIRYVSGLAGGVLLLKSVFARKALPLPRAAPSTDVAEASLVSATLE